MNQPVIETAPTGLPSRPWPVVLLSALGAWLSALPLLAVVFLLLGDVLQRGIGPYVAGGLLLGLAVVVLRTRELPVFVEQLAQPALLLGLLSIGLGLFEDVDDQAAAALLCGLCLALAAALPRAWLRVMLGAAAALLAMLVFTPRLWSGAWFGNQQLLWLALHLVLSLWLLALALHRHCPPRVRAALESVQAGWLVAVLAGLCAWAGLTMLVGASLGSSSGAELARRHALGARWEDLPMQASSALLAVGAAFWAARAWPPLRQGWCAAAALVVVALAGFMPALGACLLALALAATTHRWRLATTAALAAAWTLGAFYYALAWPLQIKALTLLGAGALLGAVAVWAWRVQKEVAAPTAAQAEDTGLASPPHAGRARIGLALSLAALLAVANAGIWQKEKLIAEGQPLFVELLPADPRSLMQGDYMALGFQLPALPPPSTGLWPGPPPQLLARRDARGVATLQLLPAGGVPGPTELKLTLTPRGGHWVLVTNAWFFPEGEAARWAVARYGEFRVDSSGRALLVGLRGAQLQPL